MSRLAELIEELCPDGVEYMPLGELLAYQQPTPFLVSSKDYDPSYPTPVLTAGATFCWAIRVKPMVYMLLQQMIPSSFLMTSPQHQSG